MDDEIERMAETIHKERPVTIDGVSLDWAEVVRSHPERARVYREAASNRIRAAAAMKRLAEEPVRVRPNSVIGNPEGS